MSAKEAVIEARSWRVVVRRVGDRGQHTIYVRDGETFKPLLVSVEGTSEELWPASPPLQQWHIECRPQSQVLLGVGMAGHSHWSLSIEASAEHNELTFDVACRIRGQAGSLVSTYDMLSLQKHNGEMPDLVDRLGGEHQFSAPFAPLVLERFGDQIRYRVDTTAHAGPGTIRWQYRFKLVD